MSEDVCLIVNDLPARFRRLRDIAGVTLKEAGSMSGIHPTEMNQFENGHRRIRVPRLLKLSRVLRAAAIKRVRIIERELVDEQLLRGALKRAGRRAR